MKFSMLCLLFTILALSCKLIDGIAVISIDFGCEYMKVSIVSPGVPMEMVLNKESKRKTPIAISVRDDEREFGENALALSTRFPEKVYRNILELIGKQYDNPAVRDFQKKFPFYKIVADETRNTVVFQHDEERSFTPEELLAMMLEKAREFAQTSAGQPVSDAVLTVPAYFNQAERKAFKNAAEIAGLKVLQLMSSNAAVALNYGVFRRKDFNSTMQKIMFYDIGAGSAVVTIVGYQVIKMKEKGFMEENPQLTVLGVGYDRRGGGFELTLRLRDYFAKKFNEKKLTPNDVFENPRAMTKLLKEAERVKMVLSVNPDFVAQVEGLLDDKDFKLPINRLEFETLCEDLFQRVGKPIEDALKFSDLTMDSIDQVILVGAGTRIPKIQNEILAITKKSELGKSLNTDEAAAMGAVYHAAHLSKGFKVKRFNVKDAVMFPIQVSFEREREPNEGTGIKHVTRTLFGTMNSYPQKKIMTFNRHVKDFSMAVTYGDMSTMPESEKGYFGSTSIMNVLLSGVADHIGKHTSDETEYKGVKAHFKMDDSGILKLDNVECVFEKTVPDVAAEAGEESAFSLIGNKISQFFSGMTGEEKLEGAEPVEESPIEVPTVENDTKVDPSAKANKTTNETDGEQKEEPAAAKLEKNETQPTNKSKIVTIKETVLVEQTVLDLKPLTESQYQSSKDKLKLYNDKEKEKFQFEEARNALESFILETLDKLNEDEYTSATTEDEREIISKKLQETSDWLYEESDGTKLKVLKEKLSSVTSATRTMYERVREHRERPEAFQALKDMLNASEYFWKQASNFSQEDQYFTNVELDTLSKLMNETKLWMTEKMKEQAALEKFKTPVVTVQNIVEKLTALDREVKYLINKARTAKPKPKKTKNETQETINATSSTAKEDVEQKEVPLETPSTDEQATEGPTDDTTPPPTEQPDVESQQTPHDDTESVKPSKPAEKDHSEL